ncbi:MAG: hypothetical protein ABEI99_05005 [Halobaculum sp.]
MVVGRYFRGLTSFDLLGNLIPGFLTTVAFLLFLPGPRLPSTLLGHALFVVVAFVVGSVVQAHASRAGGQRTSFDKTMSAAESLPNLSQSRDDRSTQSSDRGRCERILEGHPVATAVIYASLGPLFWWCLPERGSRLDDAILINRIWDHLSETHDVPDNTDSLNVLYHLMSSRVDDVQSPSRAVRMQAIRNFHRGLWIAAWYSTVLVSGAILAEQLLTDGQTVLTGVTYRTPAYVQFWPDLWQLAVVGAGAAGSFWALFESYEEDYVEYLFADYAVGIDTPTQEIRFAGANPSRFPDDSTVDLRLTAELSNRASEDTRTETGSLRDEATGDDDS